VKNFSQQLLFSDGDQYRRMRSVIFPIFQKDRLRNYFHKMQQVTEYAITKLQPGQDIDLPLFFGKYTIDVLGNTLFAYDFKRLDDHCGVHYQAYIEIIKAANGTFFRAFPFLEKFPFFPPTKKLLQAKKDLVGLFIKMMDEFKDTEDETNAISMMMKATKDNKMNQKEIIANMLVLFVAGHETTATALTCGLHELSKHPDLQEEIYQEVVNTLGESSSSSLPQLQELDNLPCLSNFMSEVLRLYPPATIVATRAAFQDVQYKNHVIPKGSIVGINITSIHRHPKYWDNPDVFDPRRFLPENHKNRHKFAYLPFSLGLRQCTGMQFSLAEQALFYIALLRKFKVVPAVNEANRKRTPKYKDLILSLPDHLFVQLEKRF